MRRYTPLVLLAVIPLILVSCGKSGDVIPTQTGATNSGKANAPYTTEQYETLFATKEKEWFATHGSGIMTSDVAAYIRSGHRNITELIESLTGTDTSTIMKRSYLRSYMGNYSDAIAERDALCKADATQCPKPSIILDVGTAVDQSGAVIPSPTVYLNGRPITMESSIAQPPVYDDMVQRVRVEAEWYLDSYGKLDDTWDNAYKTLAIKPTMAKSDTSIIMDNQSGGTYTAGNGTGSITYTLAPDTFTTTDGKKVTGNINLYLFALTKWDNNLSAFQLDVFSASGSNVGWAMITEGMPFVTAYQDGNVLKITKPIEGIGKLQQAQKYKMDFEWVPKNTWLKNEELMKYWLPGYWKLNRDSGVWTESEMQILDTTGRYRFLFI
jgi:hypothetical protein